MISDLDLFTPEVLATLKLIEGKISATYDTCLLLDSNEDISDCINCTFYRPPDECIVDDNQELLAKHFPELLI